MVPNAINNIGTNIGEEGTTSKAYWVLWLNTIGFNKLWNLSQTSAWFSLAKGQKYGPKYQTSAIVLFQPPTTWCQNWQQLIREWKVEWLFERLREYSHNKHKGTEWFSGKARQWSDLGLIKKGAWCTWHNTERMGRYKVGMRGWGKNLDKEHPGSQSQPHKTWGN